VASRSGSTVSTGPRVYTEARRDGALPSFTGQVRSDNHGTDAGGRPKWKIYGPQIGGVNAGYSWSICPYFANCLYTPQRSNFVAADNFLSDAGAGTLPHLSILTPPGAASQHNGDSMLAVDNYIASRVNAVMNGPDWGSTAIFIFYDDCGCFVDHVAPPPGLSLRVPMVIVSPYAKPGFTDSNVASLVSPLTFIEHSFGLTPLSVNDRDAYDYSASFDYTQTPIQPVSLEKHPVPRWVRAWLRAHPIVLTRGENASSLRRGQVSRARIRMQRVHPAREPGEDSAD
jgi:Phosphoesterase family